MTTVTAVPAGRRDSSRSRRYLDLAETYGQVAQALAGVGDPDDRPEPLYMLIGHAMELALKAVIARGRSSDDRLILLGHDLPLCLRAATQEGLVLAGDSTVVVALDALAMPHLAQALRYPAYMSWPLPDVQAALDALAALLSQARELIAQQSVSPSQP